MKRILVIGITGIIGFRFYQSQKKNFEIFGICRKWPFDKCENILESEELNNKIISDYIVETKPDIVINCLGLNNVSECEINTKLSVRLNVEFSSFLVELLNSLGIKLIAFSTSHVFSGSQVEYVESSSMTPINNYGKQKKLADKYIIEKSKNFLLLRLTSVISIPESFQRNNLTNLVVNNILANKTSLLVCDDATNFVCLDDVITIINLLIKKDSNGVFNISGDDVLSRYQLGELIAKKMKVDRLITKANSEEFSTSGVRFSKRLILVNEKIKNEVGFSFKPLNVCINEMIDSMRL